MQLNVKLIDEGNDGVCGRLAYQAASYIAQFMQISGIQSAELETEHVGDYVHTDISLSRMNCPDGISATSMYIKDAIAKLMHVYNIKSLSFNCTDDDLSKLSEVWKSAMSGTSDAVLNTPPDLVPDMKEVDIKI